MIVSTRLLIRDLTKTERVGAAVKVSRGVIGAETSIVSAKALAQSKDAPRRVGILNFIFTKCSEKMAKE